MKFRFVTFITVFTVLLLGPNMSSHSQQAVGKEIRAYKVGNSLRDTVAVYFQRNYWKNGSKDTMYTEGLGVWFHGSPILVTGPLHYPLKQILFNLGLDSWINDSMQNPFEFKNEPSIDTVVLCTKDSADCIDMPTYMGVPSSPNGLKILSLGEGYSPLVPALKELGADVHGLDLVYHSNLDFNIINNLDSDIATSTALALAAYQKKYDPLLLDGDATKLSTDVKVKYPEIMVPNSFDMIVAHRLFNNLEQVDQIKVLKEAYIFLKPGGTLRISHFPANALRDKSTTKKFLKPLATIAPFTYYIQKNSITATSNGPMTTKFLNLLTSCEGFDVTDDEMPVDIKNHADASCRGDVLHFIYPHLDSDVLWKMGEGFYLYCLDRITQDDYCDEISDKSYLFVLQKAGP